MTRPILLLWGLMAPAVQAGPTQVDIFIDAAHPLSGLPAFEQQSGATVTVHDLSAPETLIRETLEAGGLPADPVAAEALVRQRLAARPHFQAEVQARMGGHQRALALGIDRLPAIVFEGRQVIYGVTDLQEAWSHYRRWAAGQP